jgi:hypothetical protein
MQISPARILEFAGRAANTAVSKWTVVTQIAAIVFAVRTVSTQTAAGFPSVDRALSRREFDFVLLRTIRSPAAAISQEELVTEGFWFDFQAFFTVGSMITRVCGLVVGRIDALPIAVVIYHPRLFSFGSGCDDDVMVTVRTAGCGVCWILNRDTTVARANHSFNCRGCLTLWRSYRGRSGADSIRRCWSHDRTFLSNSRRRCDRWLYNNSAVRRRRSHRLCSESRQRRRRNRRRSKKVGAEDSIKAGHLKSHLCEGRLRRSSLQEDDALFGRLACVFTKLMEVAVIMATSEKDFLALEVFIEMTEHLCESKLVTSLSTSLTTYFSF